ncbi:unnamed protein product [Fusarium graminearum]|nr:hypothetical protein FG05_07400 [Fusarium graminearum]PCD40810.1 hypothetical protein FGRA07_02081 [Fusarium graminearum]CZS73277.1 unnamed protein product [Fusarium graminearum]
MWRAFRNLVSRISQATLSQPPPPLPSRHAFIVRKATAMTGYVHSGVSKAASRSTNIPGLTLAQSGAPENAPRGPKNGQADPQQNVRKGIKRKGKRHPPEPRKPRSESPPKVPSKGSGGVPEPTPEYLAQASLAPERLSQPRRILVVIDLNGTLLHRPNKKRPFNFTERPHATAFLNYCIETFHVAIWSSARPENVERMVEKLLAPEQREQCLVTWGRDSFNLSPEDFNSKVQVYKRLTKIWTDPRVMAAHPRASEGGVWDQTNTILVDDSFEKGRSEPFNTLTLPEFDGLAGEIPNVLPQVHDYINELSYQADISRFVRRSPFKLNPNYVLPE